MAPTNLHLSFGKAHVLCLQSLQKDACALPRWSYKQRIKMWPSATFIVRCRDYTANCVRCRRLVLQAALGRLLMDGANESAPELCEACTVGPSRLCSAWWHPAFSNICAHQPDWQSHVACTHIYFVWLEPCTVHCTEFLKSLTWSCSWYLFILYPALRVHASKGINLSRVSDICLPTRPEPSGHCLGT